MPRKTFAVAVLLLFTVLALVLPETALAGPPERGSGKMAFDEVADVLRKYRREKNDEKRIRWLEKLTLTRDPRVPVVLFELFDNDLVGGDLRKKAFVLVGDYANGKQKGNVVEIAEWWGANEADLRRRAKQLPQ